MGTRDLNGLSYNCEDSLAWSWIYSYLRVSTEEERDRWGGWWRRNVQWRGREKKRKKETNKERKEGRRFRGWILATSAKGIVTGEKPREKREGKKIADNLVQNIMHWHGTLLHTWNYSIYNKCHICAQPALTEMANTWWLD